ncbi:DUF1648 domain-containing protein [Sporolactobacillus sp. Y61]|uniref:DUF1648 domain-containing protein n=1 Tax=Sporolactobacillus sp. Y61 TaxID=3160863 RepID=A0AAU8IJY2_9BACL
MLWVVTYSCIFFFWNHIPDRIPVHFNASGEPIRWGKRESILIPSIIGTFVYLLLYTLSWFPHVHNYPVEITKENARQMYMTSRKMLSTINFVLTVLISIGLLATVTAGYSSAHLILWFLLVLIVSIMSVIIYYICKFVRLMNDKG